MSNEINYADRLKMLQEVEHIDGIEEDRETFLTIFNALCPDLPQDQREAAADRCAIFQRTSMIQERNATRH
jgi:formiminotetrahydrofolate cyclodeaminase